MRKYQGVIHKRLRKRNGIVINEIRQYTKNGIMKWKVSKLHNGPARLLVSAKRRISPVTPLAPASTLSANLDTISGGSLDKLSVLRSIESAFKTVKRGAMKGGYIRRIK